MYLNQVMAESGPSICNGWTLTWDVFKFFKKGKNIPTVLVEL